MKDVWIPAQVKATRAAVPLTASQLIDGLRELISEVGDLPVYFYDGEAGSIPVAGVRTRLRLDSVAISYKSLDRIHIQIEWPEWV